MNAGELAVVLGFVEGAGGEAAGRVGQWQMAVGKHLYFKLLAHDAQILIELHQPVARQLHRHHPAFHPLFEQHVEHICVVGVDGRTAHKRQARLSGKLNSTEIVGLDHQATIVDQPLDLFELGRGRNERQGREHHLLARISHLMGKRDPVIHLEFATLAADCFSQIDDIGVAPGRSLIKSFGVGLGPVKEQGP